MNAGFALNYNGFGRREHKIRQRGTWSEIRRGIFLMFLHNQGHSRRCRRGTKLSFVHFTPFAPLALQRSETMPCTYGHSAMSVRGAQGLGYVASQR
jgi:hypothetical protein